MDQLLPVEQEIRSGDYAPGPTETASLTVSKPGSVAPSVVGTMDSQDPNINNFHRVILRGSRQHGGQGRTYVTLVPSVPLIAKLLRWETGAHRKFSALYKNSNTDHPFSRKSTTALQLAEDLLSQFRWTDQKTIESEIKADPAFRDGTACTVKYKAKPTELFQTEMTIQDDRTGQQRSYLVAKGQFPWRDVPDEESHVQGGMMATETGSGWRDMPTPRGLGSAFSAGAGDVCAITGLAGSLQAWQPRLGVQGNERVYSATRTDRILVGGVPYTVATTVSPVDGENADRTSIGNDTTGTYLLECAG